ncbi:MAG: HAD family hydrolase [Acidobacteria bacterium]|nr:HAD family hydrolase [Acidobacteriota bacterium]
MFTLEDDGNSDMLKPETQAPAIPAMLPSADAYVFDIDGTLLVTKDLVHWNALRRAMLEVYEVDGTIAGIQYHGKTDLSILRSALVRTGLSHKQFEDGLPQALDVVRREVERNHRSIEATTCPGIVQLVGLLRSSQKLLGVASGNLERVGWRKVEAAGLDGFFSFGCFSDYCETRSAIFRNAVAYVAEKCGADARVCFIGDTPADVEAARDSRASVVAVASGVFSVEELRACSPDLCLSCCEQLFKRPRA